MTQSEGLMTTIFKVYGKVCDSYLKAGGSVKGKHVQSLVKAGEVAYDERTTVKIMFLIEKPNANSVRLVYKWGVNDVWKDRSTGILLTINTAIQSEETVVMLIFDALTAVDIPAIV